LRPTGAGKKAELDFRQAELRPLRGNPEVTAENELETTAECGAVDGRDDRFRECIERRDYFAKRGRSRRKPEFRDIGARGKEAPC
jgi:hypothetical protein